MLKTHSRRAGMFPKEAECPLLLQDHTKISWHRHDGTTEPERNSGAGELDGSMLNSVMSQNEARNGGRL